MSDPALRLTVLFVDICGSTRLYELQGDARASVLVMRCLDHLRRVCEVSGGRVVQRIGDELMCAFALADDAVKAADAMQRWSSLGRSADEFPLAVRIGLHYGPVIEKKGELFGDTVNVAARAAAFAKGSQIITTAATVAELSETFRASARPLGAFPAKGKRDGLELHEYVWRLGADDVLTVMDANAGTTGSSLMRLSYGDVKLTIGGLERRILSIGRDACCDIVMVDARASRRHALIETRFDHFVLVDQSINGTYVELPGGREIRLRHEEMVLQGTGLIGIGTHCRDDTRSLLKFACTPQ